MKIELVFIIEANNDTRFFLEDSLRNEGYPVLSATNTKQAIKILGEFPLSPNIIIADNLALLPGYQDIPLIITDSSELESELENRKMLFLDRPVKRSDLLAAIERFK